MEWKQDDKPADDAATPAADADDTAATPAADADDTAATPAAGEEKKDEEEKPGADATPGTSM